MPGGLVDSHCHLDHPPLAGQDEAVLGRAALAGVVRCLTVGTTLESSRNNVAIARRHEGVRAAVGVHPHEADAVTDAMMAEIERLAGDPDVAAIGEVGLDHYRRHSSAENQLRVFRGFIELAQRMGLPLVIHCRDAYRELLEAMAPYRAQPLRGVIHCASGPVEFIREAMAIGFAVSFAGNVTFPKAEALSALVDVVPDERLLIETDAPFLSPQPVRGQPNEPAHLAHTAEHLARLRGTTLEALAEVTSRNARNLFGFT